MKNSKVSHVVFDTNAFHGNFYFQNGELRSLTELCRTEHIKVYFPEIVVLELAGQYVNLCIEARDKLKSAAKGMGKLARRGHIQESELGPLIDLLVYDIELAKEILKELLYSLDVIVPPCPDVPHTEVVKRLYQGRKPFKTGKKKEEGYKDYLIWLTIVGLLNSTEEQERVAFVCGNTKDFCDDNTENPQLHEDLKIDLTSRGISENRIVIRRDLDAFRSSEFSEEQLMIPGIKEVIERKGLTGVTQALRRATFPPLEPEWFGIQGGSWQSISIEEVTAVRKAHLRSIVRSENARLLVEAEMTLSCVVQAFQTEDQIELNLDLLIDSEPDKYYVYPVRYDCDVRTEVYLEVVDGTKVGGEFKVVNAEPRPSEREFYEIVSMVTLFASESLSGGEIPGVYVRITRESGELERYQVFPTERDYEAGQRVTWEWDFTREYTNMWFRDPKTGNGQKAFDSSARFAGRVLPPVPVS